jgi:hypothetical protein
VCASSRVDGRDGEGKASPERDHLAHFGFGVAEGGEVSESDLVLPGGEGDQQEDATDEGGTPVDKEGVRVHGGLDGKGSGSVREKILGHEGFLDGKGKERGPVRRHATGPRRREVHGSVTGDGKES